jgi:hypothetical protein
MRIFSLLSLVVVLLIVVVVAKKQLGVVHSTAPAASAASDVVTTPNVSTPQQARQLPQQVQTDVNTMMQNRSGQLDQELEGKQP